MRIGHVFVHVMRATAQKAVIIISMEKRGYANKVYELLGKRFYVYPKNAIISCAQIPRAVLESDSSADGVAETDGLITSLTICLSISNSCNMKCDYCFNGKNDGRLMDAADIYSNPEHYLIQNDPSSNASKREKFAKCFLEYVKSKSVYGVGSC